MARAALSGLLVGLSVRGWLPGLVTCFALIPLLIALHGEQRPFRAGVLTLIASLGLLMAAFEGAIPALPWTFPLVLLLAAPGTMFPGAVTAVLAKQDRVPFALWTLPVSWTAAEFLAGRRWLWGSFASPVALGYTQIDSPLLHLAAIFGVSGVTFVVLGVNVALTKVILTRSAWPLAVPLAVLLLAMSPLARPNEVDEPQQSLPSRPTVALVQPALAGDWYDVSALVPEAYTVIIDRLVELTIPVAMADLIIWPEGALPRGLGLESVPNALSQLPFDSGDLLAGAVTVREGERFNSAVLVEAGVAEVVFDKLAPVPLGEAGITAGEWLVVGRWAGLWVAPVICLDSLYPAFTSRLARLGADLLVVMSDDSFAGRMVTPWLHLRASIFRAVETGVPLVFASAAGPGAIVAPDGRLLGITPFGEPASLMASIPPRRAPTLYLRLGEVVGTASVGLTVLILSWLLRVKAASGSRESQ
ncbi:MAG: nitrilase-related carbon-nitrogen hydrolase [Trueperaceae bacterium]